MVIKTHLVCVRRSPEVRVLIPGIACVVCESVRELGMFRLGTKPWQPIGSLQALGV